MLCISNSKRLLCTPFAGQNHWFLHENKFFHLFGSLMERKDKKRKESAKITKKTVKNDFDQRTVCGDQFTGQNTQQAELI